MSNTTNVACQKQEIKALNLSLVMLLLLGMMTHGMMMTHYRKCLTYLKKET